MNFACQLTYQMIIIIEEILFENLPATKRKMIVNKNFILNTKQFR